MKYLCVFPLFILCSCTNNRLVKDVERFKGQEIIIPADLDAVWNGRDTILTGFTEAPIKLVVWYDSLGCTSCEANKMHVWDNIANYADSLSQWFNIVYLFSPKREDLYHVRAVLKREKFDYQVFIDKDATFVKQNSKLPKNRQLHSFLLDKNNKVVLVGNPLHNPTLWMLYKTTIQKMIDNDGVLPEQ